METNLILYKENSQSFPFPPPFYFLTLSSLIPITNSFIITNLSFGPTAAWRIPVTKFEGIFLFLIYLKTMILRVLTILPINLNHIGLSEFEFYRKNRNVNSENKREKMTFFQNSLKILLKLDQDECGLLTLCQVQSDILKNSEKKKFSKEDKLLFSILKQFEWGRRLNKINKNECGREMRILREAVLEGWENKELNNCQKRFSKCSVPPNQLKQYFYKVNKLGIL